MKRCKQCGHTNGRLRPAKNYHLTSRHPTIDAAKEHADELLASFFKPKAENYRIDEPGPDQMELTS